jgi:hypothetical protein
LHSGGVKAVPEAVSCKHSRAAERFLAFQNVAGGGEGRQTNMPPFPTILEEIKFKSKEIYQILTLNDNSC